MLIALPAIEMGISIVERGRKNEDVRLPSLEAASARVKVILVEWAAYPLYRNKIVDKHVVRCGLGRMLEGLERHDAGLPLDVIVVINEAGEQGPAPSEWPRSARLRSTFDRVLRRPRQLALARRMVAYRKLRERYPFIEAVHFRDNRGQDFGAYDFGYQLLQRLGYEGDVLFMNSSVSGPHEDGWLLKYRDQFHRHPNVGLCGIALNSHNTSDGAMPFAPHVQSYFVYTNMKVLEHALGPRLFDSEGLDKHEVIRLGEIGMSERVLAAGYSITTPSFPEFAYRRGDIWSIPVGDLRYSRRYRAPVNSI
jgi:hypothetical protein